MERLSETDRITWMILNGYSLHKFKNNDEYRWAVEKHGKYLAILAVGETEKLTWNYIWIKYGFDNRSI